MMSTYCNIQIAIAILQYGVKMASLNKLRSSQLTRFRYYMSQLQNNYYTRLQNGVFVRKFALHSLVSCFVLATFQGYSSVQITARLDNLYSPCGIHFDKERWHYTHSVLHGYVTISACGPRIESRSVVLISCASQENAERCPHMNCTIHQWHIHRVVSRTLIVERKYWFFMSMIYVSNEAI
jgi:hypothetical protein